MEGLVFVNKSVHTERVSGSEAERKSAGEEEFPNLQWQYQRS